MRWSLSRLGRPRSLSVAIVATFGAAAIVLYFQHRAITTLHSQTDVILRQISEQTARDVATEVRRMLDGPVFDTLTQVNHPELRAGRLDLVALEFEQALRLYPHVERFFVWSAETQAVAPGEVLFYPREGVATGPGPLPEPLRGFIRDPAIGRKVLDIAEQYRDEQQIYVAAEAVGPQGECQALLRLFWTDALRLDYFAILGYLVDRDAMHGQLFSALHERTLAGLLQRRGGDVPLQLRILDENGQVVFGNQAALPTAAGIPLPMQFYPVERIDSRLAKMLPSRPWRIEVGAEHAGVLGDVVQGYWPTVVSVLLMLVALALTVQAQRRATELAEMQADFISHVSHQLKTPLSLLSAATETVSMDRVQSPQKLGEYLGIIRGEVARLSSLVQRILEFSRLQQQRRFEFETVPLEPLVRETVAAFAHSLSGQCGFTVEIAERPVVQADPAAIEQALVNLLDNAVTYSTDVRQVTVRLAAAGDEALIEVSDRGIGIDLADARHIFDKFYRGRGAALNRHGFGLGLPIVQELVRAHHGTVDVDSTPGRGSTFRIRLPLERPDRAAAAVRARAEPPGVPS